MGKPSVEPAPGFFGPVGWESLPTHVYANGAVLRPFNQALNLTPGLLRMSVARLLPGQSVDHHKHHRMNEIYYLMRGRSQVRVDEQSFEVEENTAVHFPPEPMRSVYNHSDAEAWWLFVGAPPEPPPEERSAVPPADTGERRFYGPAQWSGLPTHVYDSGAVLRAFNEALDLTPGLLRMSVARLLPGQSVDQHRHCRMSEIYYLMRGRSQVRVDDEAIAVEENTAVHFPPEPMRSVYNHSDAEAWWLFVGAPPEPNP